MIKLSLFILFIIFSALCGCQSTSHKAPIVDAKPFGSPPPDHHIVSPGETLYSIALKYDLDYKNIAIINDVPHPYAIHPGQRLNLDTSAAARLNHSLKTPSASAPPNSVESSKNRTSVVSNSDDLQKSLRRISWVWPINGKVLDSFSSDGGLNKGIDIRGKLRESVVAAAEGVVVYSGSGLRGYGQLVIVKHSEKFLSAYAHNEEIYVREGDQVTAGQVIARLGGSDSATSRLHFEIRLNGKPVDPLRYLPRR